MTLAASPALAQQAVTIYGVVDIGLVSDRDSGKSTTRIDSGQQTASRWGIKGKEDLGGGLKAVFQLESQIEADNGTLSYTGRLFGSQAWVGLEGGFGSVKLGRVFTPYFGAIATNDPFDARGPADSSRLFPDSGVRMDNTIKYSLPPLGGFYADLAYAAGEVAGSNANNRQISMDAGYRAGPLNIQLAHHDANTISGAKAMRGDLIGGSYDFGPVKGWMTLARSRNDSTLDSRDVLVGVSVPLGHNSFAADYVHKNDRAKANGDARQIALGYYHTLSKRSNLYLIGSQLNNQSAASYQATLPGGTRRQLTAGLRHQF
ncbi:porin [Oxalobacteraceae bacterium]|nr:porin [Oxalobacteraceae bacterium]